MKPHRRRIGALNQSIVTNRFELPKEDCPSYFHGDAA